jgi:hypothetical protein
MNNLCCWCALPLGGKMIGAGDGAGQRFAHPECFEKDRGCGRRRFVCFDLPEGEERLNRLLADGWRVMPGTLALGTRQAITTMDSGERCDELGRTYHLTVAAVLERED